MLTQLFPGFRIMLALTILTGVLYPAVVTLLCQTFFPSQAKGSLILQNGRVAGSTLIAQEFTGARYFHPRPSAAGQNGYDASASGGSNLGPTSQKLKDRIRATTAKLHEENPTYAAPWPVDMATVSASGLDPHISLASMEAQTQRIATARGVSVEQIQKLAASRVEDRDLGILGEPRVNVLLLNLALDAQFPTREGR